MADQSVFGTPEDLQLARQAALQQQALQFAQMSPMQQAQMGFFKAGNQAVDGVGAAMGAQDPQMALIRNRQSLLQGVDIADPKSLRSAAQKALQTGDYRAAQELAAKAMDLEKEQTQTQLHLSTVAKNLSDRTTTEQKNASAFADTVADRGTPEWKEAYAKKLVDLTTAAGKEFQWKELGVTKDGTDRVVYVDQNSRRQFVFGPPGPDGKPTQVDYLGPVERSTAKVSAVANAKGGDMVQETEFDKQRGKDQATQLKEASEQAKTSAAALRNIQEMQKKNAAGIYSGPQAQGTMVAANLLQSAGLLSSKEASRLTDATTYDKLAKDLVLKDLGGKLGAQISDADRQFVEARIPQLTTSPQARTELLNWLQQQHSRNIGYYQRINEYANKNKNLNGFDYADAPVAPPSAPASGAGWSIRPK